MGEKIKLLELVDNKDCKQLLIEGVDVSKYLVTYSLVSTPGSKDIILRFRVPDNKIKVQVDWALSGLLL